MKHVLNVWILLFAVLLVFSGLIYSPQKSWYEGNLFSVRVFNSVLEGGEDLKVGVQINEDIVRSKEMDFMLINDGNIVYMESNTVFSDEFVKKIPFEEGYPLGKYDLLVEYEGKEKIALPIKIMGFESLWVYGLVFLIVIFILDLIVIRFSHMNFHEHKDNLKQFYDSVDSMDDDPMLDKLYFYHVDDAYEKLKKKLSRKDMRYVDDLYEKAKGKISKEDLDKIKGGKL